MEGSRFLAPLPSEPDTLGPVGDVAGPSDARLALAGKLGNQAFGQLARATLSRDPAATAAPPGQWIKDGYMATTAYQANSTTPIHLRAEPRSSTAFQSAKSPTRCVVSTAPENEKLPAS